MIRNKINHIIVNMSRFVMSVLPFELVSSAPYPSPDIVRSERTKPQEETGGRSTNNVTSAFEDVPQAFHDDRRTHGNECWEVILR